MSERQERAAHGVLWACFGVLLANVVIALALL